MKPFLRIPAEENYSATLRTTTAVSVLAHGLILGALSWTWLPANMALKGDEGVSIELADAMPTPQPAMVQPKPAEEAAPAAPDPARPVIPPEDAPAPLARKNTQKAERKKAFSSARNTTVGTKGASVASASKTAASKGGSSNPEPVAARGNPPPSYPELARKRGQSGLVKIRCQVDGSGHVTATSIAVSSGYKLLDEAALKAVKKWKFNPALANGAPVQGSVVVPVEFKLR